MVTGTRLASVFSLQFTPGRSLASPRNLEEAMARSVSEEQIVRCLRVSCHRRNFALLRRHFKYFPWVCAAARPRIRRKTRGRHEVEVPDLHYALTDHDTGILVSGKAFQK